MNKKSRILQLFYSAGYDNIYQKHNINLRVQITEYRVQITPNYSCIIELFKNQKICKCALICPLSCGYNRFRKQRQVF